MGEQETEESMSRWESWEQMNLSEQWKWVAELCCFPRLGPVRASTEVLGNSQTEGDEGSIPGTEMEEWVTERNMDLIDMAKGPKLTVAEWSRLKRCDRPCSKEEWGGNGQ